MEIHPSPGSGAAFGAGRPARELEGLRARGSKFAPRVHYVDPPVTSIPAGLNRQRLRIQQFQRRWQNIKEDLPPQLSRRHIGMISIGGVIGTGLFLGSATALYNGGPVGALLGYSIVGSVVYCLCVSIGEMIAFLPNVGGIVGLADLYVDPAVGFSLGWAAWYNWSVTLPTEIAAAAVLVGAWDTQHHVPAWVFSAIFLILATSVNCFSSRVYGEFEFWFSTIKVVTIVFIIFVSLLIDLGAGSGPFIGFKNWKEQPFASNYLGIDGSLGRFLGFWAVLMQASFSFFGSEVPGIAAGEVIDATRNVPRALQRVWIRITLFYVGGIFCAGLLVSPNNPALQPNNPRAGTAFSSPFVIAFNEAGFTALWYIVNAAILLSAWSAAASDIYISSRFLFFLARCRHAPQVFATLFRYPSEPNDAAEDAPSDEEDVMDMDDEDLPYTIDIRLEFAEDHAGELCAADNCYDTEDASPVDVTIHSVTNSEDTALHDGGSSPVESSDDPEAATSRKKQPWFVLPLYAVLGSASIGLLSFLSASSTVSAESAFNWLSSVASVASLQSWAGMLFTYIRWFQGTAYAERKNKPYAEDDEESRKVLADIQQIKINRHWGQPYLAWYAFSVCMIILFTNGWSVFIHNGWKIAIIPGEPAPTYGPNQKQSDPVSLFLSSYIPIPFFLLLTFGYKLIHQTKMVPLEAMTFSRCNVPLTEEEPKSNSKKDRFLGWLLVT